MKTLTCLILVVLALTACNDQASTDSYGSQEGTVRQTPTGELTAVGEKGLFRFRIQTEPAPIKLGDYFSVWTIVERVEDGAKVGQGTLELDATMPAHRHGMTTLPRTRLHDSDRFHTVGCRFHMHGRWVIELNFEDAGKADRATIEFPFHPPAVR